MHVDARKEIPSARYVRLSWARRYWHVAAHCVLFQRRAPPLLVSRGLTLVSLEPCDHPHDDFPSRIQHSDSLYRHGDLPLGGPAKGAARLSADGRLCGHTWPHAAGAQLPDVIPVRAYARRCRSISAPYARRKRLRITPAKVGYDIAPTSQIRSCLLALSGRGQLGCDLSLRRPRLGLRLVRALP